MEPSKAPQRRGIEPSLIKNKIKRSQVYHEQKARRATEKRKERAKRKKEEEELGDEAPAKKVPRTLDNTREADETVVTPDDAEALADEAADEFASYYTPGAATPKLLLTSNVHPSAHVLSLIDELISVLPTAEYHRRGTFELKQIVEFACARDFTDVIVVNEDRKKPNGLVISHLPDGPTMHFKLSSLKLAKDLPGHGKITKHQPELILNGFTTRLGHTVGRQLGALLPHRPNFHGRRVVTFHNQVAGWLVGSAF
eukprot:TRINITY_DN8375_c0_g1_i2.p1 TRINITY_DN8375_c0_g1~~TRINITY_DN8375_c0_g1_i2.p1  ORF type:complete len:255 (-),score=127.58 TRINITY_DN8375_c0_g1_i2:651-1415(-)